MGENRSSSDLGVQLNQCIPEERYLDLMTSAQDLTAGRETVSVAPDTGGFQHVPEPWARRRI